MQHNLCNPVSGWNLPVQTIKEEPGEMPTSDDDSSYVPVEAIYSAGNGESSEILLMNIKSEPVQIDSVDSDLVLGDPVSEADSMGEIAETCLIVQMEEAEIPDDRHDQLKNLLSELGPNQESTSEAIGNHLTLPVDETLLPVQKLQWCEPCSIFLNIEDNLELHHELCHKPCTCNLCSTKFADKEQLDLHFNSHTDCRKIESVKYYNCSACSLIFCLKASLDSHFERCHVACICGSCGTKFVNRIKLGSHLQNHMECVRVESIIPSPGMPSVSSAEMTYPCAECNVTCSTHKDMDDHFELHHRPRICSSCDMTFANRDGLELHLRSQKCDTQYWCKVCLLTFGSKFALAVHEVKHTDRQTFLCSRCQMTFSDKLELAKHVLSHASVSTIKQSAPGPASMTSNSSSSLENQQLHAKRKSLDVPESVVTAESDPGELPIQDNRSVDREWDLQIKKIKFEPEERPANDVEIEMIVPDKLDEPAETQKHFRCNRCAKHFMTQPDLNCHLVEHTHMPSPDTHHLPFQCRVCETKLRSEFALAIHSVKHSVGVPFACSMCPLTFSQKLDLAMHMLTHGSTERSKSRLRCEECALIFFCMPALMKHMRLNHTFENE